MKSKRLFLYAILAFLPVCANATINDVSISPTTPTSLDSITILVSGEEGTYPAEITNTDFFVNGNSLTLDIYLYIGPFDAVSFWSCTEIIGTLPADTYNLTVWRFLPSYYPPSTISSYSTSFEVVPEPATLLLMVSGLLLLRKNK
jgi:hypothetical protein